MKKTSDSTETLMILVLIAPFIYLGFIWSQLPAEVTTHYGLDGTPDGQMPKGKAALLMGFMAGVVYLLLRFLPSVDPKGRLQSSNYQKLRLVITLTFAAITGWLWYMAGHHTATETATTGLLAIVSLMIAGIGNYITTVKPNWFVGIRTPWTLQSEEVWRKTHRMGGRLMVAGGLLSAVLALVIPMPYTVGVVFSIILIASIIPVVYSYIYFQQEKAHQLN